MLAALMMFISADWLYGAYAPQVRTVFTGYFIMLLVTYTMFPTAVMPTMKVPWQTGLGWFAIGAMVTAVFLYTVPAIGLSSAIINFEAAAVTGAVAIGGAFSVMHTFIKAYIEEHIFRHALCTAAGMGIVVSSAVFGIFHLAVLMMLGVGLLQVIGAVVTLSVLGFIWALSYQKTGSLMFSIGSHFVYNIWVFGLAAVII